MPGTAVSTSDIVPYLIVTVTLRGRYYYYHHFAEETEAQGE